MFKKLGVTCVLASVLMNGAAIAGEKSEAVFEKVVASKTIRCGYFVWPPYIAKDPNTGKMSGINYDIMEAIGKNLGLTIDWVSEVGAGDVVTALETGKFDAMCASVWPNPGRVQNLTLTAPTFFSTAYAFVREGDKRFDNDLSKANNKDINVSAIDADITQDLAIEKLPLAHIVALPQTASGTEILMQIATKKADIALMDESSVNEFEKANPHSLRKVQGVPAVRVFGEDLAVKRGEYSLKNMIDESIHQLTNDGVIEKIVKRYSVQYGSEIYPPQKSYTRQ